MFPNLKEIADALNGTPAQPDAPQLVQKPAPNSPEWLTIQLTAAKQVLAERESALAAKATPEYAAWREMMGVVNTLTTLVALTTQTSEQE